MIYKEIVKELDNSPFSTLIKSGASVKNIQDTIVVIFDDFFNNKENLKRFSHDLLIHDFINYTKTHYVGMEENIAEIITFFNSAKEANSQKTYEVFAQFQNITLEMSNKEWSMIILQRDLKYLAGYEYVTECFSLIADICEVQIKSFLTLILCLVRITQGKEASISKIQEVKFGNIVNELEQKNILPTVLSFPNKVVSISQWRNIACHKNYCYDNENIICSYGNSLQHSFSIQDKETLKDVAMSINRISQALNFAAKFFLYDNIEDIKPLYLVNKSDKSDRQETWQLIFSTELYMNGFRLIDIKDSGNKLCVVIQDMTDGNERQRSIQSSVAIYKLWELTKKEIIDVVYLDSTEKKRLHSSSTDKICEKIASSQEDISYLAKNATFTWFD